MDARLNGRTSPKLFIQIRRKFSTVQYIKSLSFKIKDVFPTPTENYTDPALVRYGSHFCWATLISRRTIWITYRQKDKCGLVSDSGFFHPISFKRMQNGSLTRSAYLGATDFSRTPTDGRVSIGRKRFS